MESPPFDRDFYLGQTDDPSARQDPRRHYDEQGWKAGLDPTPHFATGWYAWQNPDWPERHATPYAHFLELGRFQGRDPSPLVDTTRVLDCFAGRMRPEDVYPAVLGGLSSPALGVYASLDDVVPLQAAFRDAIRLTCLRDIGARDRRRHLVFLQAGPRSLHRSWCRGVGRTWDLLVNYYDAAGFDPEAGDYAFSQPGTKFTAIQTLLERRPDVLLAYDHVLFLDDDILTTAADLDRFFGILAAGDIALAQMALAPGSHCIWPALFRDPASPGTRDMSAVEIMMPAMSRATLRRVADTFAESVSGFGLDLLWGKRVAEAGGRICVVDAVAARHDTRIDDSGGAFYSYMRANLINPKAELWRLVTRHGLGREIRETGSRE